MNIAAIVPTRNEQDTITDLVAGLYGFCDMVVVADDSTGFGTATAAYEAQATLADAGEGLAGAYRSGWELVPSDWWVVHVDAGGSHQLNDVERIVRSTRVTDAHIVIGSRFTKHGHHYGPLRRKVTSRIASVACNLVSRDACKDWTSGLRAYSPEARKSLTDLTFTTSGHAWQIESLNQLFRAGFSAVELPISYYPSGSQLSGARVREAFRYWRTMVGPARYA